MILALLLTLFLPEKKTALIVNVGSPKKTNRASGSDDSDKTAESEISENMPMLFNTDS